MDVSQFVLGRYAVISPHLDDGVFGCGQFLAAHPGGLVITAFAAKPETAASITRWDDAAGFQPGSDVMAARCHEDRRALEMLAAEPIWLDFRDRQYGARAEVDSLAAAFETELVRHRVATVFIPLGLHHADHQRVHAACIRAMRHDKTSRNWIIYEDAIYRRYAGLVTQKLSELEIDGLRLERVQFAAGSAALKKAAAECYTSQLRALNSFGFPGYADVFEAETYWRIQAG